jgi:hypothetical protein
MGCPLSLGGAVGQRLRWLIWLLVDLKDAALPPSQRREQSAYDNVCREAPIDRHYLVVGRRHGDHLVGDRLSGGIENDQVGGAVAPPGNDERLAVLDGRVGDRRVADDDDVGRARDAHHLGAVDHHRDRLGRRGERGEHRRRGGKAGNRRNQIRTDHGALHL